MKNSDTYFIPLITVNGFSAKSQRRQRFINEARKFLPNSHILFGLDDKKRRYKCHITFFYKGEQLHDLDNALKTIFDAIKGKLIPDDRNIKQLQVTIHENSGKMGIKIKIKEVASNFGIKINNLPTI